ncbi:MAG TPA: 2Fe-2S iron-sulfur cluster-binding protein [Spongiibacteraceae bacterium]
MADIYEAVVNGIPVRFSSGEKLIELHDRHSLGLDFMCRAGACGVCTVVVKEGHENISERTEVENILLAMLTDDQSVRLGCQIRLNREAVIESVDLNFI